jgi:pyridoxamine 5'-phosphate oxidase
MIRDDRAQARRMEDPNADVCFLALADASGTASVRTLVMREITGNHFRVFMNQSSPKWKILSGGGTYQLLLWYPSMQRQYRVNGSVQTLDSDVVKQNWLRRPRGSKYLDLLYENVVDQSTYVDSRDYLVEEINKIKTAYKLEGMEAPDKVAGVELIAEQIEMLDLNREDRIHDRRLFVLRDDDEWDQKVMIP